MGKHKSRRDDSSSSSDSSDDERRRKHKKDRKKKRKESRRKRAEATEDELIMTYSKKKMEKKNKDLLETTLGYSDESNPFGDARLSERFVWKKKIEKDLSKGKKAKDLDLEGNRFEEHKKELEKARQRRNQREEEKAMRDAENQRLDRERNAQMWNELDSKESEFNISQAKLRSQIRIKEDRPKPIDVIYKFLSVEDNERLDFTHMQPPHLIFQQLNQTELKELREEIEFYSHVDDNQYNRDFWNSMVVLCDDSLQRIDLQIQTAQHQRHSHRSSSSSSFSRSLAVPLAKDQLDAIRLPEEIKSEVERIFNDKGYDELVVLEMQIREKLASNEPIDVEYWESLLKKLIIHKAKAKINQIYKETLTKRLSILQQHRERLLQEKDSSSSSSSSSFAYPSEDAVVDSSPFGSIVKKDAATVIPVDETLLTGATPYEREVEADREQDLSFDDLLQRKIHENERRMQMLNSSSHLSVKEIETRMKMEETDGDEEKLEGDSESIFSTEVDLKSEVYSWHDRYRPRKPKYYNRIKTGYEWTSYNRTHYDHDNPPPKVVQGYKFNIFYPDLIDSTKSPTYVLSKESDENCIIRFHAGPPYEDIAFRVVNREWETSTRRGFRCTFDRGVLHLWFNFRRYRYRR